MMDKSGGSVSTSLARLSAPVSYISFSRRLLFLFARPLHPLFCSLLLFFQPALWSLFGAQHCCCASHCSGARSIGCFSVFMWPAVFGRRTTCRA